jgi:homoserine dehydrogenase
MTSTQGVKHALSKDELDNLTLGVDVVGFGPIGRELAKRLVSERELENEFAIASISDTSATVYPRNSADVLRAIESKNVGNKLSQLRFEKRALKKSSIFVDLTSSNYKKASEATNRAVSALSDGKHFVSASKVALSNSFSEIFSYAKERRLEIGYGATICGGRHAISVARNIGNGEIQSVSAVLNASTTLILSMLEENHDLSFDDACKKAAEAGVLESDWSIDLDGIDAAAKAVILGNVLFPESNFSLGDVAVRGVRDAKARALISDNSARADTRVRLVAEIAENRISVEPKAVPADSPLAVKGRFNAVLFKTKTLGEISVRNLGGGVALTASVIISDLKRISSIQK